MSYPIFTDRTVKNRVPLIQMPDVLNDKSGQLKRGEGEGRGKTGWNCTVHARWGFLNTLSYSHRVAGIFYGRLSHL